MPPPIFKKERRANFIKNAHYDPSKHKKEEGENENEEREDSTLIKE